ncbi:hypothetical protein [Sphingomonas arenae]|uniref:hypothetical protein n=1 Tax=Sphingomonas arenae TaxID=2812555 RepID=UPI0019689C87|nr:hypothetical protein [Sphingomonas arenae]
MLHLLVAMAMAAQEVPTPPVPPVPEAPLAGEGPKTTIVEIHRVDGSNGKTSPLPPARSRPVTCEGHKFEFTAASGDDPAKRHKSRIVLCSEKGASNARIIAMLEDAARRLESNEQLPAANRDKIVSDIRAKAAELKSRS